MFQFLQNFNIIFPAGNLNLSTIIFSLLFAFIAGLIISSVYRMTNKGFFYEASFNFTLLMVCLVVTTIMMIIGSNIALSLGLIGSLSIIRFRTAIKNSIDMGYLFWSIAVGLAIGAQSYYMAIASVVFIGIVVFFLSRSRFFNRVNRDYMVIVRLSANRDNKNQERKILNQILVDSKLSWKVRSSFVNNNVNIQEVTYSVFSKDIDAIESLLDAIKELDFVEKVSLLHPETNSFV